MKVNFRGFAFLFSFEQQPWAIEAVWTTSSLTIPPGTFGGECSRRKPLWIRPEKAPCLRSINTNIMMSLPRQAPDKIQYKVKRRGVFFTGIAPENPAGASDGHLIQSMDEDVIAIHLK